MDNPKSNWIIQNAVRQSPIIGIRVKSDRNPRPTSQNDRNPSPTSQTDRNPSQSENDRNPSQSHNDRNPSKTDRNPSQSQTDRNPSKLIEIRVNTTKMIGIRVRARMIKIRVERVKDDQNPR